MDRSEEWQKVNAARRAIPVDVEGLARDLAITVRHKALGRATSGYITKRAGGFFIAINTREPRLRRRFTLGHELGHYMLHRDHIWGDDDPAQDPVVSGTARNRERSRIMEFEADRFAADLLMPHQIVRAIHLETRDVAETARVFGVSRQAMAIRLGVPYHRARQAKGRGLDAPRAHD